MKSTIYNAHVLSRYSIVIGVLLVLGAILFFGNLYTVSAQGTACTQEAKICPDGSAVGRTGPDCAFAACPSSVSVDPSDNDDLIGDIDLEDPSFYYEDFSSDNTPPSSSITITVPQTFSLAVGHAATVKNAFNFSIRLDKITLSQNGGVAFMSVMQEGGCGGATKSEVCLGMPSSFHTYQVPLDSFVDVFGGLRISFLSASGVNGPATFRVTYTDPDIVPNTGEQDDISDDGDIDAIEAIQALVESSERAQSEGIEDIGAVVEVPGTDESGNTVYQVAAKKPVRLFNLFPIRMSVTVVIDEEGEIKTVDTPWWSFLAW